MTSQPRPWRSEGLECRGGSEVCSRVCTTARQGLSPARGCQPSAHTSLTQPWPPEAADLWGVTGRGREWGSPGNRALDLLSVLHQNDPGPPAQRPQTLLLLPEGTGQLQRAQCPTARSLCTAVHITSRPSRPQAWCSPTVGLRRVRVSLVCVFPCSLRPVPQPAMSGPLGGFQLVAFVNCAVLNIFDF